MPPKRKIDNTEENEKTNDGKDGTKGIETKNKKKTKINVEPTTRSLRSGKVPSIEITENAGKTKSIETQIENESETNDVLSAESILDFSAKDINGNLISLQKYKGHVCIIVNVASRCGHTSSNYKEFVELYDMYSKDKGLKILAFPCNQFGKQEPGDNKKISEFAKKKNVKFDMFEKVEVNGQNAHPLWKYLTSQKQGPKGAKIDWNFTKFLINKEGQVVERFKPSVKPSALVKELEKIW